MIYFFPIFHTLATNFIIYLRYTLFIFKYIWLSRQNDRIFNGRSSFNKQKGLNLVTTIKITVFHSLTESNNSHNNIHAQKWFKLYFNGLNQELNWIMVYCALIVRSVPFDWIKIILHEWSQNQNKYTPNILQICCYYSTSINLKKIDDHSFLYPIQNEITFRLCIGSLRQWL